VRSKAPTTNTRRVNKRFSWYRLEIRRSRIHRLGVFASEPIPAGKPVIKYTGKRLSIQQAIDLKSPLDRYLVRLSRHCMLDGRVGGSGAELVNHSCSPNLTWKRSNGRLTYWSRRKIKPGEELTLRYAYPVKLTRVPCHCGASKCRGTLRFLFS
jgi:uncharacterized protein